ncbi:unnamed protein product [Blepharisma stoltei]|uniref:Phosphodiesterase n=1 Tax=Blepharisma stoltei TaxID=1481888 RepID=A0AAU9IJC8_9CILI|nr:unnamed protein product [Blepharisma stoltei]
MSSRSEPISPSIFLHHRPSTYGLLGHENHENQSIPINPNLLWFTSPYMEDKFIKSIYCDRKDHKTLSLEFRSTLLVFYLYLTLYITILIAFSILLNADNEMADSNLRFQLIFLSAILIISYMILYSFHKSTFCLYHCRFFLMLLGFLFLIYLIVGDERVLSGMLSEDYHKSSIPSTLGVICWIIMMRNILFDSFYLVGILCVSSIVLFLSFSLSYSPLNDYSIIAECAIMVLFLGLQVIEAHKFDYRSRQLFYRAERERENFYIPEVDVSMQDVIKSEIEHLVNSCDSIKNDIKYGYSVVMFKDVKNRLKNASIEVEKVKRRIAHGHYYKEIRFQEAPDIDKEDIEFINQNYMEVRQTQDAFEIMVPKKFTFTEDETKNKKAFPFRNYGASELESVLSTIGRNWNFDIWFIYNATGSSIFVIAKYLLKKWNLNETFNIPESVSDLYFKTIEKGYNKNPYHNACHAADVLHCVLFFIQHSSLHVYLSALDILSSIIASLGHDVGHPALTNRYLINNHDELAYQYNDQSVLENMHCSNTFTIMQKSGCNVLEGITSSDWFKARKLIIDMILGTDMSKHFELLGRFRTRAINLSDLDIEKADDKVMILAMALKCGDIGHSAKVKDLHEKWSQLVCEEFFNQGDLEKKNKQPVSMYCDRDTTNIPKSQAGFIKNICLPLFEVWCSYLKSDVINTLVLEQMKKNLAMWEHKSVGRRVTQKIYQSDENSQESFEWQRHISISYDQMNKPTL